PLMRPCGIATPSPSPVEPRRSRANSESKTLPRSMPWLFSKSSPTCSNSRFLLVTCRSSTMFCGGSKRENRFMAKSPAEATGVLLCNIRQHPLQRAPKNADHSQRAAAIQPPSFRYAAKPREGFPGLTTRRGISPSRDRIRRAFPCTSLPAGRACRSARRWPRRGRRRSPRRRDRFRARAAWPPRAAPACRRPGSPSPRSLRRNAAGCARAWFRRTGEGPASGRCRVRRWRDSWAFLGKGEGKREKGTGIGERAVSQGARPRARRRRARARLQRFSPRDGRNAQRLAIFRDRAAGDDEALLGEQLRDAPVGERIRPVLGLDDLADHRAYGRARRGAAGVGGDVTSEEVFQLEGAEGRQDVLARGHARDGRLVQAERVGDLAQHERAHRHRAVREERALPVDDRLRDAQDRLEALLQVLDQQARLLQLPR